MNVLRACRKMCRKSAWHPGGSLCDSVAISRKRVSVGALLCARKEVVQQPTLLRGPLRPVHDSCASKASLCAKVERSQPVLLQARLAGKERSLHA